MNTRFEYLYRDGSNYKRFGAVVFAGESTEGLTNRLIRALDSGELFIADQIRIPEIFFEGRPLYADDHCWHELLGVDETSEEPTDQEARQFDEFVTEVERARISGWKAFDRWEREVLQTIRPPAERG